MKRLVLIGGGHSHVEVLRRFAIDPLPDIELTLINPGKEAAYSGMLPGWIAGHYSREQCHIDLARLCRRADCRLVLTRCIGMNSDARQVFCENDATLAFDLVSVDTGGRSPAFDIPGAVQHALPVRPVESFVTRWTAICNDIAQGRGPGRVAVVGAGAAGVEVLLAMQHRLGGAAPGHVVRFVLVSDSHSILPEHSASAKRRFVRILRQRNVDLELGRGVVRISKGVLECADAQNIRADLIVIATGASAPFWPKAVGLATDTRGFILVDEHLQSVSHPAIFAAGDIATVRNMPRPKSGVFAVRAGPPLAENLRRALYSLPLRRWRPQPLSLALISTGDRHAIASRGRLTAQGRWVWRWKDWIDRRFVGRYL